MNIEEIYQAFCECRSVTTDSRKCPAGALFIALKGDSFDGNAFAAKALENGCARAVVDDPRYCPPGDPRYLLVGNGLETLQRLANHHRRTLKTPVIGITGTNGKTTTKELMAAVLSQSFRVCYTQGNLNNSIGVPLTLLTLRAEHQLAIVEMGASHPGDIRELAAIAEPDYGIVTNVGKAHLEGFGSFEGVVRTKGELFDYLRSKGGATAFVCDDSPRIREMAHGLRIVDYGTRPGLCVSGRLTARSACLQFEWSDGTAPARRVATRLIGSYNLPNALAAVAVGRHFGVEAARIDEALAAYTPQNSRSQLKETGRNTLILDAYNANPTSMMAALENFARMEASHKAVILGDMLELGAASGEEHRKVVDYVAACHFEHVWLVGNAFAATCPPYPTFRTVEELADAFGDNAPRGYTILVKGSNGIHLGRIAERL